jgi:hypothetical protein
VLAAVTRLNKSDEVFAWRHDDVMVRAVSSPVREHYASRVAGTRNIRVAPRNEVKQLTEWSVSIFRYSV